MSDLENLADDFELITEIGYDLSQKFDGVDTDNRRKKVSTYYLAKIVPECISQLKILPWSSFSDREDLFDFSSFCSLGRNIIEAANLHWYYCVDEVSKTEIEFRFLLYDYHDLTTIYRLGAFLGTTPEDLNTLKTKRHKTRGKIEAHSIFNELGNETKRQIIKGRKCSHLSQTELSMKRALDMDFFNGIYKLLSNNVHSTPSAISTMVHTRIHGKELEEAYTVLLLTYVPSFVADMIKTIGKMWDLEFAKTESEEIIEHYSGSLYVCT